MNKESLKKFLETRHINVNQHQLSALEDFMNVTLLKNKDFNLTAITEPSAFIEKMILDSALGMVGLDLKDKNIIDIGTGAGFPGMVLYILDPTIKMTLLDSTNKKINHLEQYCHEKSYSINTICSRAEDYAKDHREIYDFVFCRAVASLPILLETTIPLLKNDGQLIALKGPNGIEEIELSKNAFKKLHCHLERIYEDVLPESGEPRTIICIKKDSSTPLKYPREYKDIKSRPL